MHDADLNIIPSRPSMFDLWASARTRAALKEIGADFVFLLNQCPPAQQTARVQDGVEALEEMGGLISPLVLTRVDYQEAARHGWGVTEINPYGAAAEEMRGLWRPSSAGWRAAKPGNPRARRLKLRGGPRRLAERQKRERPSSLPRADRQDAPGRPAFFCVSRRAGADHLSAALDRQIPQPRAFGAAAVLQVAGRCDLLRR